MKIIENNQPLAAVVCGFEHSGTTLITEILRKHVQFNGGFEGGFLLNEEAKDFLTTEPYCTNLKNGWNISDEDLHYICYSETWATVYAKLQERSSIFKGKDELVFDKTPMYMKYLPDVLKRVPGVPCILIVRDLRAIFWSSFKRTGLTISEWYNFVFPITCEHVLSYADGWRKAIEYNLGSRILLIQYESLCLNPVKEVKRMTDFLKVEFDQSLLSFGTDKHPFVYGERISTNYLKEYLDGLPCEICEEIVDFMRGYEEWLW